MNSIPTLDEHSLSLQCGAKKTTVTGPLSVGPCTGMQTNARHFSQIRRVQCRADSCWWSEQCDARRDCTVQTKSFKITPYSRIHRYDHKCFANAEATRNSLLLPTVQVCSMCIHAHYDSHHTTRKTLPGTTETDLQDLAVSSSQSDCRLPSKYRQATSQV